MLIKNIIYFLVKILKIFFLFNILNMYYFLLNRKYYYCYYLIVSNLYISKIFFLYIFSGFLGVLLLNVEYLLNFIKYYNEEFLIKFIILNMLICFIVFYKFNKYS